MNVFGNILTIRNVFFAYMVPSVCGILGLIGKLIRLRLLYHVGSVDFTRLSML
jgi:hypothetical protein